MTSKKRAFNRLKLKLLVVIVEVRLVEATILVHDFVEHLKLFVRMVKVLLQFYCDFNQWPNIWNC